MDPGINFSPRPHHKPLLCLCRWNSRTKNFLPISNSWNLPVSSSNKVQRESAPLPGRNTNFYITLLLSDKDPDIALKVAKHCAAVISYRSLLSLWGYWSPWPNVMTMNLQLCNNGFWPMFYLCLLHTSGLNNYLYCTSNWCLFCFIQNYLKHLLHHS